MRREIAGTIADATLPKTPITIRGKEYNLCFDLGALAEAETAINADYTRARRTERVNLLVALTELNLANTRTMFAAGIRAFHPELGFEEARELLGLADIFRVVSAIEAAWARSTAEPEKKVEPERIEVEPEPVG